MEFTTTPSQPQSAPQAQAPQVPASQGGGEQYQEQAPQPAPQATQHDDNFATRFEMLTRKERVLQQQAQQFKSERQSFSEKQKELELYYQQKELAKYDPLAVMQHFGWDAEKLAEYVTQNNNPYEAKYNKKIEEIEGKLSAYEQKQIADKRAGIYHNQINAIKSHVEQSGDKFELIRNQGAHNLVFEVQAEYFKAYGEKLDIDVAAENVEKHLEKQIDSMLSYNKVRAKLQPNQQQNENYDVGYGQQQQQQPQTQRQPPRPRTLTNSFAPVNAPMANRPLTREESLARAAKLIKWND